jgi:hypothetical protein
LLPFPFADQSASKLRPAVVAHDPYPSDDLLVVAVNSERGVLRPGECELTRWREAGLLHPSFLKRAVTIVTGGLVRRPLGVLRSEDLVNLDRSLCLWLQIPWGRSRLDNGNVQP